MTLSINTFLVWFFNHSNPSSLLKPHSLVTRLGEELWYVGIIEVVIVTAGGWLGLGPGWRVIRQLS